MCGTCMFLLSLVRRPHISTLFPCTTRFRSDGFPAANAIDGQANTGWAIHGPGKWNVNRTATFQFERAVSIAGPDRKSTRLNSRHLGISYAVFCLKKQKKSNNEPQHEEETRR